MTKLDRTSVAALILAAVLLALTVYILLDFN